MALTKATYSMVDGAPINVKDYGAIGDGVTDDTAALQAAIDAAIPTGKQIVFPQGNYITTSQLNVNLSSSSHALFMQGNGKAQITSTATGSVIDVTSADPNTRGYFIPCVIDGMFIFGDGVNNDHVLTIYGTAYANSCITNSNISGAKVSLIELNECWEFSIDNSQIGWGAASRTTSGTIAVDVLNANAFNMTNCDINNIGSNYSGTGVRISSATAAYINNNTIENVTTGVEILSGQGSVVVSENYFENMPAAQAYVSKSAPFVKVGTSSSALSVSVVDNWFSINNDQLLIEFDLVSKGYIARNINNNVFVNPSYYNLTANTEGVIVENNDYMLPPVSGKAGLTATDFTNTMNAKFSADHPSLWVPASAFQIYAGTPTQVAGTYGPAWQMQNGSTNGVEAGVVIPPSWGICTIRVWSMMSFDATTSDAITWYCAPVVLKADGTTISNGSSVNYAWDGRPANTPRISSFGVYWDVTRTNYEEPITVIAQRLGAAAGDTFTGNAILYGVLIERVPVGDTY